MRRSGLVLATSVLAGSAAWLARGTLAVTGAGSSLPRLGVVPPLWQLLLAVVVCVPILLLFRRLSISRLPVLTLGLIALPWLPGSIPTVFLVWTGTLAGAVWIATVLALAVGAADAIGPVAGGRWVRNPRLAPWTAALIAGGLYLGMAWWLSPRRPMGDEPHYLVITQSVLLDGDLRIENNHREGDYLAYVKDRRLDPDFLRRGTDGQIYSVHAPGLPTLVAPAFHAFGYPGVLVFLAIVAALATALAWWLGYLVTASVPGAWFGWAAVSLSSPFFFHAFAVFPDAPAAAFTLVGVWGLVVDERWRRALTGAGDRSGGAGSAEPPWWRWTLHGASLAVLPWLHTRDAVLAAVIGAALVLRIAPGVGGARRVAALLVVPCASAVAWFGFFHSIYGTFNPAAPYGGYTQSALAHVPTGLSGLLFDQQFGLVPNAPVYLLAVSGLVVLARHGGRRRLAAELTLCVLPYLVLVGAYRMWWGGASAPARFAVPSLLVLAIPLAALWTWAARAATRVLSGAALAVSVLVTAALGFIDEGRLLENDRDGYSRLLESLSPVADLPLALPSLLRDPPAPALAQTFVWVACLVIAWIVLSRVERRRPHRRDILVAVSPVILGVAGMVACGTVWWLGASPGIRPAVSQARLLSRYTARQGHAIGYPDYRRLSERELLSRLSLESTARRGGPRSSALFAMPWLPAGRYRVEVETGAIAGAARVWLGVGDSDGAVLPVTFADAPGSGPEIAVPVDVFEPFLAAEEALDDVSVVLRPVPDVPGGGLGGTGLARRAKRYGSTVVYLLGEGAYIERSGLWIVPGRPVRLAVESAAPSAVLPLFVRNAPVTNALTVTSGKWHTRLDLAPGEERTIEVPRAPDATTTLLEFSAANGFRPVQLNPASGDYRRLGCWIEVR